jgi:hypothetical protein
MTKSFGLASPLRKASYASVSDSNAPSYTEMLTYPHFKDSTSRRRKENMVNPSGTQNMQSSYHFSTTGEMEKETVIAYKRIM